MLLAAHLWFCSLLLAAPQEPVEPPPPPPPPETTTKQIVWQRNLADALAAQQASGLPLLIVVNQDGEAFNDRFATKVYQDPEFVALTEGYVCVIASPVQHNQADHDENGNRIDCPRFPGCTCSEHITIEPELYKRWFKEQRVAPRHLAVAADGTVLRDLAVFRRAYALVGLGWLYAATRWPLIGPLADGLYGLWAGQRLRLTGRPDLDSLCASRRAPCRL